MKDIRFLPIIVLVNFALLWLSAACENEQIHASPVYAADGQLRIDFIAPTEVLPGEPVLFEFLLTNESERFLTIWHGNIATSVEVVENREVIWRSKGVLQDVLLRTVLAPGESREVGDGYLEGRWVWEQTDENGRLLAPGTYEVRGSFFAAIDYQGPPETFQATRRLTITY
ncbi:MAG: hypothetical protein L0177_11775 [Chloroflexi bacterium]|nr:hypothetical protein [Chloroflexota bacterium]MCI0559518.1 hypothetical protein [Nitrososphaera sp.]